MKTILIIFLSCCFPLFSLFSGEIKVDMPAHTSLHVTYTNFNSHPVTMEFDSRDGQLSLRVRTDGSEWGREDHALEFLRLEVVRLTSTTNVVALGDGFSFHFRGGYPIWKPYMSNEKSGVYRCLVFAEGAQLSTNKVIEAQGPPWKPYGYYPYPNKK